MSRTSIPSIEVTHLSKRYRVGRGLPSLWRALRGARDSKDPHYHWALEDVSFELQPGEALGIIGPNGAGKTTILKILSRVTRPTGGEIRVNGRLSALIELGAGFHPDLTGRENIFLNGTILGMRRSEIKARFDRIVEFAGVGKYLDTPVKRYSSGMHARLGFAVAAHVDPQILLVDEVLAVGDFAFQTKCHARMEELRRNGTSLIFISHNMEAVRQVCDRGLVMYRGEAIFQGTAAEAVVAYSDAIRKAARKAVAPVPEEGGLSQRVISFDVEIEKVSLLDARGQPATTLPSGSSATVVMDLRFHREVSHPIFAFKVRTPEGRLAYSTTTQWMELETPRFRAGERCCVEFSLNLPLLDGVYELGVNVAASDLSHYYDVVESALTFLVNSSSGARGMVDLGVKISFKRSTHVGVA